MKSKGVGSSVSIGNALGRAAMIATQNRLRWLLEAMTDVSAWTAEGSFAIQLIALTGGDPWRTLRVRVPAPKKRLRTASDLLVAGAPSWKREMMSKAVDSVIFDFGGPVTRTPFEMIREFERRRGLPERTLDWRGPFDPDADAEWRKVLTGEMKERDYWRRRAEEIARFTGGPGFRLMFDALYNDCAEAAVRPEAEQMLTDIKAAGLRTAILTNDMAMFHSPQFLASVTFVAEVDIVVDASITNVLKPDPRAYLDVLELLGSSPECAVFTDDMPHNVRGAEAVGMCAVWFDVRDPRRSYAEVARVAGLAS